MGESVFRLEMFGASDAARVTGLSMDLQRVWRMRGFLASQNGRAEFDAFELAEILVLKTLADGGIGPNTGQQAAKICAISIVWFAFARADAFAGIEAAGLVDAHIGVQTHRRRYFQRELVRHFGEDNADAKLFAKVMPSRFLVWWPGHEPAWYPSLDHAFNRYDETDTRCMSATVVLDLESMGFTLVERAGRPLVHVETGARDDR